MKSMCKKSIWVGESLGEKHVQEESLGEKSMQEEFLGEESLDGKYMVEKYMQEESRGEKYTGEMSVPEEFLCCQCALSGGLKFPFASPSSARKADPPRRFVCKLLWAAPDGSSKRDLHRLGQSLGLLCWPKKSAPLSRQCSS